jgi:hypothetical protein
VKASREWNLADAELERQARAAAKEYHNTTRKQKRSYWHEFLDEDTNIWQAARFLNSQSGPAFDKILPLVRADKSVTKDQEEQAAELLSTFFPPLPEEIDEEPPLHQRQLVDLGPLTMEEIEWCLFAASSWKAPGDDHLPTIVWKQMWPVVKNREFTLFKTLLEEGKLPTQWRSAKIILLKKPEKDDYSLAKAWRPISLLSTLGKILEAVVAERISYAAETFGLLPANHFGARKKRSTEQALMVLQEHIYKA